MKRFLLKIAALAAALLVLTGLLFSFVYTYDRNGYFCRNENYNPDNPTGKMALFRKNPCENIIIGDSRVNELTGRMDVMEELSGMKWFNMGVGGASQIDINNLFRYCDSVTTLKNVILTVSFRRMQVNDHEDRVTIVRQQLENPLRYLYNIDTLKLSLEMLRDARAARAEEPPEAGADPSENGGAPNRPAPDPLITELYELCTYRDGYVLNTHLIDEMRDIAAVCEEKGICLIIVALPYREDVREYVIEPLGLEPVIESYKAEIAAFAELYDMEFDSDFTRSENFRDTTHFSASGQLRFLNALFRGDDEILICRGPSLHTDVPRDKITE